MEKICNRQIEEYVRKMKNDINNKIIQLGLNNNSDIQMIYQYILDYEKFHFVNEKKKNENVLMMDRCCANRSNGEQCTRKKKTGINFCGTHSKTQPYGIQEIKEEKPNQKIEIWTQDIKGIQSYIDKNFNIYEASDILEGKKNPRKIGKYSIDKGEYKIA